MRAVHAVHAYTVDARSRTMCAFLIEKRFAARRVYQHRLAPIVLPSYGMHKGTTVSLAAPSFIGRASPQIALCALAVSAPVPLAEESRGQARRWYASTAATGIAKLASSAGNAVASRATARRWLFRQFTIWAHLQRATVAHSSLRTTALQRAAPMATISSFRQQLKFRQYFTSSC